MGLGLQQTVPVESGQVLYLQKGSPPKQNKDGRQWPQPSFGGVQFRLYCVKQKHIQSVMFGATVPQRTPLFIEQETLVGAHALKPCSFLENFRSSRDFYSGQTSFDCRVFKTRQHLAAMRATPSLLLLKDLTNARSFFYNYIRINKGCDIYV